MRRLILLLAALLPAATYAQTTDKVLQRIRDSKTVRIAYRTDARPFSYEEGGQPAGNTRHPCKPNTPTPRKKTKVPPSPGKGGPGKRQNPPRHHPQGRGGYGMRDHDRHAVAHGAGGLLQSG